MKRRVLLGVLAIALIAGLVGAFTYAYFSDPEAATATFSAGTIDISVAGENPVTKHFEVGPFKPSETGYITFRVRNVGNNEAVIWKMIEVTNQAGGLHPESELAEDPTDTINNLKGWMFYDLDVVGVKTVIPLANEVRVDNVENCWIKLGVLAEGAYMDVSQSYHLRPETTNWAQGDKMDFNITLLAVQTNDPSGPVPSSGTMVLDNKDGYWRPIADGVSGTVNYTYSGGVLNGTFGATGLADGSYDLIYYSDPWPGTGGLVLGTGVSAAGGLPATAFTGAVPSGTDTNLPVGVKVWLVPAGEFVPGTPATWPQGWRPSLYLFDMNLINLPQ